jgi:hypothetical protein
MTNKRLERLSKQRTFLFHLYSPVINDDNLQMYFTRLDHVVFTIIKKKTIRLKLKVFQLFKIIKQIFQGFDFVQNQQI